MPTAASAAPARFTGFADRDARFFKALAKNQRREWFQMHRDEYETGWRGPMQALLDELREKLDRVYPRHPLAPPKVFRIHRDVRFGKDKSPYKTHVGGFVALEGAGEAGPSVPCAIYLHVGATETFVAAGHYLMLPPQLKRFREAVLDDTTGAPLGRLLAGLERAGFEAGAHSALQRVPRGVDPDHPRAELLKRRGLIVSFPDLPRNLLPGRQLVPWLVRHATRVAPLVEWLAALSE